MDTFKVTRTSPGRIETMVSIDLPDLRGAPIEVEDAFSASGWIVGAESLEVVDERPILRRLPSIELPVPFFRSAAGKGLEVVRAGAPATCLQAFDIEDVGARKECKFESTSLTKPYLLDSQFSSGRRLLASVFSHLNSARWESAVPEESKGLVLWKRYDRFHGRQRARVLVDGVSAGWWYEPEENRTDRWAWSRFGIDRSFLEGKSRVTIEIDPQAGSSLWSVSRLEVWSLDPATEV